MCRFCPLLSDTASDFLYINTALFETIIMSLTPLGPLRASVQRLPLFSNPVAAGFPSPAEDHIEAALSLDELCIRPPAATYLLRAAGDRMLGAGICDGYVLVVDRSIEPRADMIVVASVRGDFTHLWAPLKTHFQTEPESAVAEKKSRPTVRDGLTTICSVR